MGDTVRRGPGDTQRGQVRARDLENAALGALDNIVVEFPGKCTPCGVDVIVSYNAAPIACWELLQNEA